jgi:hypothetical protein
MTNVLELKIKALLKAAGNISINVTELANSISVPTMTDATWAVKILKNTATGMVIMRCAWMSLKDAEWTVKRNLVIEDAARIWIWTSETVKWMTTADKP